MAVPQVRRGKRGPYSRITVLHPQEYKAWKNMRDRCTKPWASGYERYGGRGISYCTEWESFQQFLTDMGPCQGLTLERRDVEGNYCKDNCCWATREDQDNNRRNTRRLTVNGETLSCAQWERRTGINRSLIAYRARAGFSPEQCLHKGRLPCRRPN